MGLWCVKDALQVLVKSTLVSQIIAGYTLYVVNLNQVN